MRRAMQREKDEFSERCARIVRFILAPFSSSSISASAHQQRQQALLLQEPFGSEEVQQQQQQRQPLEQANEAAAKLCQAMTLLQWAHEFDAKNMEILALTDATGAR